MENSCSVNTAVKRVKWDGTNLDVVTELYSYELDEVNRTIIVKK